MIDINDILEYDSMLMALFILAGAAWAGSIYLRNWMRSCNKRCAAHVCVAAAEVDRSRGEEAAAKLQAQALQDKYDRLRDLTFDLQTKLDAIMTKQKHEPVAKPLVPPAPRVLTADGRGKILTYLKNYTNQMSLTMAILDNPEAYTYGMQIVDALTTAVIGVYVTAVSSFYVVDASDEVPYGIRYTSSCPEPVQRPLESADFEPSRSRLTPNRADLYIGLNSSRP